MENVRNKYGHISVKRFKKVDIVSLNQAMRIMDADTVKKYIYYANKLKKLVQHNDQRIFKVTYLTFRDF